ncbi:BRO family protein [uncultured Trichococcus sp.]|uniref:BRO family protein n=1 Tax=uncultured Trichococcus sp. TaxID=189665 RepID=UPI0029C786BD|nr:BRO family protein [uncultured Trichococcus sp.]
MSELQIFNFENNEVRTMTVNDEPFFVANDVAKTLGYANPSKATNDHCKKGFIAWGNDSLGRHQQFKLIPESDVYRLVFRSKLPESEKFENWVTEEVLPSIRKKGFYEIPKDPMDALRLMFQATEHTQEKVNQVDARVMHLEENVKLDPGEYTYIGKSISRKVYQIGKERAYSMNREQKEELFKAINKEIAEITGVRTRTQLRQKDYKKVIEFIDDWEPSKATSMLVKNYEQMEMEV